jgi:hypothetical protein
MPILKILIYSQGAYFHWENDIILVLKIFWMSIYYYFFLGYFTQFEKNCQKMGKIHQLFETTKVFFKNPGGWGFASRQWMA